MYVIQLIVFCIQRFASQSESLVICNSRRSCNECRSFIKNYAGVDSTLKIRIAELCIRPNTSLHESADLTLQTDEPSIIYTLLFPIELAKVAKQFWQHTGQGVSSRYAEHCLRQLEILKPLPTPRKSESISGRSRYIQHSNEDVHSIQTVLVEKESDIFVEERFGRNLDVRQTSHAIRILKRRISGALGDAQIEFGAMESEFGTAENHEDDVFLFPGGMSAIYQAHKLALALRPGLKSVQFGYATTYFRFPYIDTLKLQQKFGPGCHFFGYGNAQDLASLETLLTTESVSCIICEFPSNPLLKSPPLFKLWALANQYNFILIIDETVGNPVNISCLAHTHMIVSSLTKIFSGDSNVMAGSLVLNPASRIYAELKKWMGQNYNNEFWCEDVLFIERNSRTFKKRIFKINKTAEILCDVLKSHAKGSLIFTQCRNYSIQSTMLNFMSHIAPVMDMVVYFQSCSTRR